MKSTQSRERPEKSVRWELIRGINLLPIELVGNDQRSQYDGNTEAPDLSPKDADKSGTTREVSTMGTTSLPDSISLSSPKSGTTGEVSTMGTE